MKRIAAPMVGGMITSTVLTLAVIPAIYGLWKSWDMRRSNVKRGARPEVVRYSPDVR